MRLYSTHFNFCRDHRGLTKEKQNGVSEEKHQHKKLELLKENGH